MNASLSLILTPERVVQLAQGYRTKMVPHPIDGNPDFKTPRVVEKGVTFTREGVIALLEESFDGVDFDGRRLFYAQDRNIFWYDPERTNSDIIERIKQGAVDFVEPLREVRGFVRAWLTEKGAYVIASEQGLYPLVSPKGSVGDNSTRWGAVIGNEAQACKLSLTPLVECGVTYPIVHPHLMDEQRETVQTEWALTNNKLAFTVKGCHLTFATNMQGTPNLDEATDQLDARQRMVVLKDGLMGLKHLHDLGLVYCDFKVEQILAVLTEGRYVGKLADLETLRPVGYYGEFLANRYIDEDWYYNIEGVNNLPPRLLPVDHARDVFSVGASLLEYLLRPYDPDYQLYRELLNNDEDLEKRLKSMLHERSRWLAYILKKPADERLDGYKIMIDTSHIGVELRSSIVDEYKEASNFVERGSVRMKYSSVLSKYMPENLADCIVRAMSNARHERPQLSEIIEAMES